MRYALVTLAGCTLPPGFHGALPVADLEQSGCSPTGATAPYGTTTAVQGVYAFSPGVGRLRVNWAGAPFACDAVLEGWSKKHGDALDLLVAPVDREPAGDCECPWNLLIDVEDLPSSVQLLVTVHAWDGVAEPVPLGTTNALVL